MRAHHTLAPDSPSGARRALPRLASGRSAPLPLRAPGARGRWVCAFLALSKHPFLPPLTASTGAPPLAHARVASHPGPVPRPLGTPGAQSPAASSALHPRAPPHRHPAAAFGKGPPLPPRNLVLERDPLCPRAFPLNRYHSWAPPPGGPLTPH
ncbi:MAG: hypothetical protein J3K34DRAFT_405199 [Monoraphidium minutum]|nr:MAG: hypothetical protein J3K34DRAFT_405199 [Monoraphidium minutum]